ncbi:MAG: hypothetical protein P9M14_13955 [Candidatus Alcyoniella australis]|nr:hypothetical protein [Candidatus Alcyoniella australis]
MIITRSIKVSLCLLLATCLLCVGCAPVSYNRYQTANTLGAGEMKLMIGANAAHDVIFPVYSEIELDMNDEMYDWARENGVGYDLEDIFEDVLTESVLIMLYVPTLGLAPDFELLYAVGVHDRVDIEARLTASLYGRLNAKVLLAEFGDSGALSISPGVGFRDIKGDQSENTIGDGEAEDSYSGYVLSAELPLLIGRQGEHVSPYIGPLYVYHYADIDYRRKTSGLDQEFDHTIEYGLSFHQLGLIVGSEFHWGHFSITPELVGMYHNGPGINYWMLYPGLALGGSW